MKAVASAVLIALGTASTGAMAAGIELYGRIDGGLQYVKPSSIDGVSQDSTFGLVSGHTNGSRWGIKGSEDLGGGTRAVFIIESGFSVDDGMSTQGGRLFGREARLGLENKRFGNISVGRFGGLSSGTGGFNMMRFDPFATAWDLAGMKAFSFTNKRLDNAVAYRTPSFAGVSVSAMHSFAANGQEVAGADNNERYSGLGAGYKLGKLNMALMYEQVELPESKDLPTQKSMQFGAYYDFPVARAYFNYEKSTDVALKGVSNTAGDANSYMVGFKAKLPSNIGEVLGSYQYRDGDAFTKGGKNYEGDLQIVSLGYLYTFSKRTQFYANYVFSKGDKSWAKDAGINNAGWGAASSSQRADYNSQVATIGLRTRF